MADIISLFMFICMVVGGITIILRLYDLITGKRKARKSLDALNNEILYATQHVADLKDDIRTLENSRSLVQADLAKLQKKLSKDTELYRSILHAFQLYNSDSFKFGSKAFPFNLTEIADRQDDALVCMQIKDLRSAFRKNQKQIESLISSYESKFSNKANSAVFQLMVLGLTSEMREILHGINFGKLEDSLERVRDLMNEYHSIAVPDKLRLVVSPFTKFIGQLEFFYLEAVRIEYESYVKRERAREEQRALKEQMRQEAEERKALEAQRKKMEAEEAKYEKEMTRISALISSSAEPDEIAKLRAQLEKIQAQLSEAQAKKEKIVTLQNGKAGTVYVISNIGSFGEDVFKIGMTRRDEPMDRIRELGDASVPFPFDVHSFIFSNDAVGLETNLHHILNNKRVNKINLRKEFFRVSLDELQALVEELDPSAAFNRTALAEQFRQSLSIDEVPETVDIDMDE